MQRSRDGQGPARAATVGRGGTSVASQQMEVEYNTGRDQEGNLSGEEEAEVVAAHPAARTANLKRKATAASLEDQPIEKH